MERRLAAILAADAVGYSRLIRADKAGTRAARKAHCKELIEPKTAEYHGCVVKLMADSKLMELGRVVDALLITVVSRSFRARADWRVAEREGAP